MGSHSAAEHLACNGCVSYDCDVGRGRCESSKKPRGKGTVELCSASDVLVLCTRRSCSVGLRVMSCVTVGAFRDGSCPEHYEINRGWNGAKCSLQNTGTGGQNSVFSVSHVSARVPPRFLEVCRTRGGRARRRCSTKEASLELQQPAKLRWSNSLELEVKLEGSRFPQPDLDCAPLWCYGWAQRPREGLTRRCILH